MKMSKSVGNTINPLDLMRDYGADILRLWALSVDFTEDHRIGKEILDRGRRPVSQAAQHLPLSARRARRVHRGRAGHRRRGDARARALHAVAARRSSTQRMRTRGRELRLQRLYARAGRLLQRGSVRLLLRYPQGQPLLRRRDRPQAPRLSHRARHLVPRAGPLGRAGAGVHGRGSVGHALSRRRAACICSNGRRLPPRRDERARSRDWDRAARAAHPVTEAIEPLRRDKTIRSSLEAEVALARCRRPRPARRTVHRVESRPRRRARP